MDKEIDHIITSPAYNELYNDSVTAVERGRYKKMIAMRKLTQVVKDMYPGMGKADVESLVEQLEEILASSLK